MAKRKGPGLFRSLWHMGRMFAKAFDKSAEIAANHLGNPKPARARRASLEWTERGKGEHLPATPITLRWLSRHAAQDKEIWRATFIAGGVFEFETWPPRDYDEAVRMAMEYVVNKFGVFAESWECSVVEFRRKVVPETEDIEA